MGRGGNPVPRYSPIVTLSEVRQRSQRLGGSGVFKPIPMILRRGRGSIPPIKGTIIGGGNRGEVEVMAGYGEIAVRQVEGAVSYLTLISDGLSRNGIKRVRVLWSHRVRGVVPLVSGV